LVLLAVTGRVGPSTGAATLASPEAAIVAQDEVMSTCVETGESCAMSKCCSEPGARCYKKHESGSVWCNQTCDPYYDYSVKDDAWFKTSVPVWDCEDITIEGTSNPAADSGDGPVIEGMPEENNVSESLAYDLSASGSVCSTGFGHSGQRRRRFHTCGKSGCCSLGTRYTTKGSGHSKDCHGNDHLTCNQEYHALVSNSEDDTWCMANPAFQRLHVSSGKCKDKFEHGSLKSLEYVKFNFGSPCGGKDACYQYWPVESINYVHPDTMKTDYENNCFQKGQCSEKGVHGLHATVSQIDTLDHHVGHDGKQVWLGKHHWSYQKWTIVEEPEPYSKCGPSRRRCPR